MLWVFIGSFFSVLNSVFMKLFRRSVNEKNIADGLYYVINIPVALLYYGIMCGFELQVNIVTLVFSALFSIVCYLAGGRKKFCVYGN